jgi:hypothetical protein
MRNEEWIEMIRLIPTSQHPQLVVVLQNGGELSVDMIYKCEPNYVVLRGRVAGTTDEGRGFFVPYDQMLYLRLERKMKVEDLAALFGETPPTSVAGADSEKALVATEITIEQPTDPATTTRNALLERIRAARNSSAGTTTRAGSGS